jgi:GTP-binding protein LepA
LVSAKTGLGVPDVLEAIARDIPAPEGDPKAPLQALIFDSYYDSYRGVVVLIRVKNGSVKVGDKILLMHSKKAYEVTEVGIRTPNEVKTGSLECGEVGYLTATIKDIKDVFPGETITLSETPAKEPLPGYRRINPMVYCGLYPSDSKKYEDLKEALEKLSLNDASLVYQPETSQALGFGFRCGFLGLLHMEIIQERLDREFDMDVITTVPNVSYMCYTKQGEVKEVHNPSGLPDQTMIDHIEEPYIRASIITAADFIGPIMTLCLDKRGELIDQQYVSGNRVELHFMLPLGEIVIDFYDKLKSISKGYASFDYHIDGFRPSKLAKLDILLNGEPVDALSTLTHQDNAVTFGRRMCEKLKELIPRQQFDIAIQAAIGAKIIARETVKQVRKDVTAKCYGGDVSRKRKLLEKQKRGKKRMKQIGNVEVPQKAFLAVLKLD